MIDGLSNLGMIDMMGIDKIVVLGFGGDDMIENFLWFVLDLNGGVGNDWIVGGIGDDLLIGGDGDDFVLGCDGVD